MLVEENHRYIVGKDCPYGYYIVFGTNKNEDAIFEAFNDEMPWCSHVSRGYFCCIELKHPNNAIEVKNGKAIYIGQKPFNLYETIKNSNIPENFSSPDGVSVYLQNNCEIKVHQRKRNLYFYNELLAEINDYIISSINGYFFVLFLEHLKSFHNYDGTQICLESKSSDKEIILGKDGVNIRAITHIELRSDRMEFFACSTTDPILFIATLPSNIVPTDLFISWVCPNKRFKKLFPTEKNKEDIFAGHYDRLITVLKKYQQLGLDFELPNISFLDEAPDFSEFCALFLEKEYVQKKTIDKKKPNKNEKYTFLVESSFDKKYYCAVKLAEKANDIQLDNKTGVYSISFSGDQTEAITLMYHNMTAQLFDDTTDWEEILNYLNNYDFFTHLKSSINSLIALLREQDGYSGFITSSVLIDIIKSINKYNNRHLNELYVQMVEEKRVATKWNNEFHLYSIIKSYFKDAIYQYRAIWLGRQSFDIYIPSKKIAIEYQGKQHYEPISHFGGQDGYNNTNERDQRKKDLALEYGITVLEWKYDIAVNNETVLSFLADNNIDFQANDEPKSDFSKDNNNPEPIYNILMKMAPMIEPPKSVKKKPSARKNNINKLYIIRQYNKEGKFVDEYDSIAVASQKTNINEKNIRNVIYGARKSGGGFIWARCKKESPITDVAPVISKENTGIGKPIKQLDLEGNLIEIFPSKNTASRKTGVNVRCISDAISGVQKTAGGYLWEYIEE